MRKELTEEGEMPELIIPFFMTFEEARRRMLDWGHAHQNTPEGKSVVSGMGQFKGCYLPYQLVRGPVHGTISRDGNSGKYQCDGYLEGTAVNTSSQLDNLVLNEVEPFDWSAARPFTYGYIAGHKVKLNDISEAQTEKRILAEAAQDFRPEVERVMQTSGVGIQLTSGSLMELSVLLPVYFIKSGKLTAVMNGQTGRIAVSKEREKKSYPWMIEPLLYTILATLLLSIPWHLQIEEIFLDEHFCDCISACDSGSICPLSVYGAGRSFYGRIPDAIRSSMVCADRNDRRYVSGKRSASGCL